MKINSVELENFKTHVKSKVSFSKGLNLVLGQNGAGKSSILQAIGFALANVKGEGSYKDFITNFNESTTALVKVSFTAQDGLEYSIVRKINESHTTWDLLSPSGTVWRTQNKVVTVLKELTGIHGKMDDVYKRVITAHQNDMTSVFSMTASQRKKFFDELFNTQVYKEMYNSELKAYSDELENMQIELDFKQNSLKEETQELENLKKKHDELSKNLDEANRIFNKISTDKLLKEEKLKEYEKMRNELEKLKTTKTEKEKREESAKKNLNELNKNLEKAIQAEKTCKNYKSYHDEYEKLYEKLEAKQNILIGDEKKLEALREEEKKLSTLKNEREKMLVNLSSFQKRKEEVEMEINALKAQTINKEKTLHDVEKEYDRLTQDCNEKMNCLEKKETFQKKIENTIKKLSKIEAAKNELMKDEIQISNEELKRLEKKVNEAKSIKEHLESLSAQKYSLIEKLNNLSDAENSLSGGTCPLLNEKCLNLKGKDVSLYFDEKKMNLKKEIDILNSKIENMENEIKNAKEAEIKLIEERKNEELFQKKLERINALKEEERTLLEEIKDILKVEEFSFKKIEKVNDEKRKEIENLKAEINSLAGKKEEIKKRREMLKKDLKELKSALCLKEKSIQKLLNLEYETIKKVKESEKTLNGFSKNQKEVEEFLAKVKKRKDEILKLRQKLTELRPFYEEYNKKIEMAKEVEHLLLKVRDEEEEKKKIEAELSEITEKIENLSKIYNEKKHFNLMEEANSTNEKLKVLNSKITEVKGELMGINREIEKLKEKKKLLEEIEKELSLLKKKKKFVQEFRNMLNGMGGKVAERYRKYLASKATFKYRELTNKSDKIEWRNDYDVHLVSQINGKISDRSFSHLSGGEQMVVALCLRAALNEMFSTSKFVIFDEPTVNLDAERKRALSEYLPKLFKDMEQVIVITHDESFREMAEKIVFIEKINGVSHVINE
ncbi:AAA family ATPase [Mesoaciditoga sp.]